MSNCSHGAFHLPGCTGVIVTCGLVTGWAASETEACTPERAEVLAGLELDAWRLSGRAGDGWRDVRGSCFSWCLSAATEQKTPTARWEKHATSPVAALHSIISSFYQPLQVAQVWGQDGA